MTEEPARQRRTILARIRGRVQGVGFRWTCQQEAMRLGLVGEVRNLDDGSVSVIAQGATRDVARLIAWLYRGPRWSAVEDVIVEDLPVDSYEGEAFRVRG